MVPAWFASIACCPEDRGALDGSLRCGECGRSYAVQDGVVVLLPERTAHIAAGAVAAGMDDHVRWVDDELAWWNPR